MFPVRRRGRRRCQKAPPGDADEEQNRPRRCTSVTEVKGRLGLPRSTRPAAACSTGATTPLHVEIVRDDGGSGGDRSSTEAGSYAQVAKLYHRHSRRLQGIQDMLRCGHVWRRATGRVAGSRRNKGEAVDPSPGCNASTLGSEAESLAASRRAAVARGAKAMARMACSRLIMTRHKGNKAIA